MSSELNVRDLLQTPQPPMKVTPLQFLRVFEVEWLKEKARTKDFESREFSIQRLANFREQISTLQIWESVEKDDEVHTELVATLEAQVIPQKNELYAIQYAVWHLPTDRSRRFLSILEALEVLPGEAARATVILNGMLSEEYRPSLDISELADSTIKSKRGRSIQSEMRDPTGGAMSTRLAEEALGLGKE